MRAVEPQVEGLLDRGRVKVGYAVWGSRGPYLLFAPAWLISEPRIWKAQVPYLSRHFRVITVDPRGNGRSDRPVDAADYSDLAHADDLIAALDAVGARHAVVVALSRGVWWSALAATRHPGRIIGLFGLGPAVRNLIDPGPDHPPHPSDGRVASWQGLAPAEANQRYRQFMTEFFALACCEPHSTKQIEDGLSWSDQTTAEAVLADDVKEVVYPLRTDRERVIRSLDIPVMIVHGSRDRVVPAGVGQRVAELSGGHYIEMKGAGHLLAGRFPVPVNRWIKDFADRLYDREPVRREWTRPLDRPKRVLYVSSPIGLGHARRDLAIVDELRKARPGVQVDWLAQHPVTALLRERGERVHPASASLASESAHWESESDDHDLHAFQALRQMDEILVHNFMIFSDLIESEEYDLWIGDEAWDVDHFLHENPELKRAGYAWLTDFVGFLPMPDGGDTEAALTADYNAEMLEQIGRLPRLRDHALFIGEPDDIVADSFGAGLPKIRDWTEKHYRFTGYVTGIDPNAVADRAALRAEFGWPDHERVCVVTVGGTAVGARLLHRILDAHATIVRRNPDLRLVVVTGPRLDPAALPSAPGAELHAYLPRLYRYLAACDIAVVQGGLSTTMELVAARRPFIYVPLERHFEQQFHVPHRLARYGAGRRLDYADVTPDTLAEAIAEELTKPIRYAHVDPGGAARAAALLAELL